MKKKLFDELSESICEAGAVQRGEAPPSRVWMVRRNGKSGWTRQQVDVGNYQKQRLGERKGGATLARARLGLSQEKFAALLGVSVATLRNWEQGRRQPTGAARILLRVVEKHPEVLLEVAA